MSECVLSCGADYEIKPLTNICKRKCHPSCLTCDDINYLKVFFTKIFTFTKV